MKKPVLTLIVCLLTGGLLHAASPLPTSSPERQDIDGQRLKRMHDVVGGYVAEGKHAGAVAMVVRNGRIVNWQTWGAANLDTGRPFQKDSIFRIYSMSKILTSVAVLQLFEESRLVLNQPVTDFVPELKGLKVLVGGTADVPMLEDLSRPITIRMLLNHTAGFTYDFFEGSPVHELYKEQDLWNSTSLDEFIERVASLPLLSQPGEAFNYGINIDILGLVVQRVSGMPFEEYLAKNITGPLEMVDTGFYVPEEKLDRLATIHQHGEDGTLKTAEPIIGAYAEKGRGIPSGGGGLFSTIGDYSRFGQCLLNGGKLGDVRILGRKTIELALRNSLPEGVFAFVPSEGWGLMSALRINMAGAMEPASEGMFYWSGAATTHFFADPTENLMGLVFSQHIPFDEHDVFARFQTSIYQALE